MAKLMVGAGRRPEGRQEWSMEPATRGSRHEARLRYGELQTADCGPRSDTVRQVREVREEWRGRRGMGCVREFCPVQAY